MAEQFLYLMGNESLHSLTGRAQPDKACPEILRVQRAGMKGCAQQRKACRQHPPCEFVERAAQRRNLSDRVTMAVAVLFGERESGE